MIAIVVMSVMALTPRLSAQENQIGPPVALQFPSEATATASRSVNTLFLRAMIEQETDLVLCRVLMTRAGRPIPSPFLGEDCEPSFAERVRNGEGIVHWADGARPLECGDTCVGPPRLTQTDFVTRPNLRQATWHGTLKLVADPPGPTDRALTYGYDVRLTCKAENGAQAGDFTVAIDVQEPVIGDPGFIESVFDFFGSGNLSNFVENRINQELQSVPLISQNLGQCASVGVFRGTTPRESFTSDGAVYDPAPAASASGLSTRLGRPAAQTISSRDRATIHFHRIVRKRTLAVSGVGQAPPDSPEVGQFDVFLNGLRVALPPLTPNATGAIDLPPEEGVVNLNYCKTIDVTDFDRLQLLFANGFGSAVWSQFGRADDFGAGAASSMTTGRTVVLPASPGPPDPQTGRPTQNKPQAITVREFELVYTITYAPRSDTVVQPPRADSGGRTGPVRGQGRIATPPRENATADSGGRTGPIRGRGRIATTPMENAPPDRPAPTACRQI